MSVVSHSFFRSSPFQTHFSDFSFFLSPISAFSCAPLKNNSSGFFPSSLFFCPYLSLILFFLPFLPPLAIFCHSSMFYTVSQSHQLLPLLCDSSIICSQFGLCLLPLYTFFFSCIHPPSVKSLQHFLPVFTVTVCPDFSSPGFLISHPSGLCLCHGCQLFSLPPRLCLSLFIANVSLTISSVLPSWSPHGDTQQMRGRKDFHHVCLEQYKMNHYLPLSLSSAASSSPSYL